MGGRAPGTVQGGYLHCASAQPLQSYSVRTARISAGHLRAVHAGVCHLEKLKREPNRPLLHFAGPGRPGGQFHHCWCGRRHLSVHRWTAVLITLQPPLRKGWTDGGWQGKTSAHDKTKHSPPSGTLHPRRFGVAAPSL